MNSKKTMNEIKQELDNINSRILVYSLKQYSLKAVVDDYGRLMDIRDKYMEIGLKEEYLAEVEHIRFCLLEEILMIRTFIKEKLGQEVSNEIEKLKHLYKINEK